MEKRATRVILAGVAAIAMTTGVSAAIGTYHSDASLPSARKVADQQDQAAPAVGTAPRQADQAVTAAGAPQGAADEQKAIVETSVTKAPAKQAPAKQVTAKKAPAKKPLPAGLATATSFWDAATASGKPMSFRTIASPYWPLGTKVKITYKGKSLIGVVDDFGPAEWAVAQHDIPAIIDLSEKMMASLTGTASNTIHANFQVLAFGHGRKYRTSGTGFDLAFGTKK
jgi:hypothetical protein